MSLAKAGAAEMASYRLLFFQGHRLDRWETLEASDYRAAVEAAARLDSEDRVELWSESGKLATFRPMGARHARTASA